MNWEDFKRAFRSDPVAEATPAELHELVRLIEDWTDSIAAGDAAWLDANRRLEHALRVCIERLERLVSDHPDQGELAEMAEAARARAQDGIEGFARLEDAGFSLWVRTPEASQIRVFPGMPIRRLVAQYEHRSGVPVEVDGDRVRCRTGDGGWLDLSRTVGDYEEWLSPSAILELGPAEPGGFGERPAPHSDGSQVKARPWTDEDDHDFEFPVQAFVSDGRSWEDVVNLLDAVRDTRTFAVEVDELDDLRIYRLISERPDLKEDIWRFSSLRQRIFEILLCLPPRELKQVSKYTLSDSEFLQFANSSEDARRMLERACSRRMEKLDWTRSFQSDLAGTDDALRDKSLRVLMALDADLAGASDPVQRVRSAMTALIETGLDQLALESVAEAILKIYARHVEVDPELVDELQNGSWYL